jgi:hypothetical protein
VLIQCVCVAVCTSDIGASTKASDGSSIGEFGIGFKSVFALSHAAYVRSGHFCFKFAKGATPNSGLESYLVPHWVEPADFPHTVAAKGSASARAESTLEAAAATTPTAGELTAGASDGAQLGA